MSMLILRTKRLILRQWCESDLFPFAEFNADPKVMEFYFPVLDFSTILIRDRSL